MPGMGVNTERVAIAGIGESKYYKRGKAPVSEFRLAVEAISKAAEDAGIAVTDIDGFASYSNDRNDASRMAAALGFHRCASPTWFGVEAEAAVRLRSEMPQPVLSGDTRRMCACFALSHKGNSPASARLLPSERSRVRPRTRCRMEWRCLHIG